MTDSLEFLTAPEPTPAPIPAGQQAPERPSAPPAFGALLQERQRLLELLIQLDEEQHVAVWASVAVTADLVDPIVEADAVRRRRALLAGLRRQPAGRQAQYKAAHAPQLREVTGIIGEAGQARQAAWPAAIAAEQRLDDVGQRLAQARAQFAELDAQLAGLRALHEAAQAAGAVE